MIVTSHVPSGEAIDTDAAGSRDRLRELYAPPRVPWLRLNLIQSVNGSAQGADGTSETLSNAADRAILGVIRSLADVVLIGAQTLRAEEYLLPRRSRLAVITASGELGGASPEKGDAAEGAERPSVIVVGPARAERRARETLPRGDVDFVPLPGTTRVEPRDAIGALRGRGARSIVCEGGPRLGQQLLEADLVDELCLSISPRLQGGDPVLGDAPARELVLGGLLADDAGGLYTRWLTPGR